MDHERVSKFFDFLQLLLLMIVSLLLLSCSSDQHIEHLDLNLSATPDEIQAVTALVEAEQTFRFGFDLRHGPKEDAKQYLPLLDYLMQTTGYRFSLHFTVNSDQLLSDLTNGQLHFAAIGAGSYLTASHEAPILPLVRGVNAEGEAGYHALLVVKPDSPLINLSDLKDRHLAFGSPTSTQGHWIPRIMLHKAGLNLNDLHSFIYTDSHRGCAEAVISGKADVCGMQDTLALHLIEMGLLRALAVSDLYPSSGIFSHASVPQEKRFAVRDALLAFDPQGAHQEGLYNWQATEMAGGFVTARPDDFEPLRSWAMRLGLSGADPFKGVTP
jgi:phosphonate transport system substrate-binding protein